MPANSCDTGGSTVDNRSNPYTWRTSVFDMPPVADTPPAVVISHETTPVMRDSTGQTPSIQEQFARALTPGSLDPRLKPPECCITPPPVVPDPADR
jgi:hypothetical protein